MENEKILLGITNKEPLIIDIAIVKPTILEQIQKKDKKTFKIFPIVLSDLVKITDVLITIPAYSFENKTDNSLLIESFELISKYTNHFLKIISIITGAKIKFLRNNLTTDDLLELVKLFIKISNVQNFTISIASVRTVASLKSQ